MLEGLQCKRSRVLNITKYLTVQLCEGAPGQREQVAHNALELKIYFKLRRKCFFQQPGLWDCGVVRLVAAGGYIPS